MELLQQLVNALTQGSIYALIALGYTMVYGVLRLINFAHGEVYMIGAFAGLFGAQMLGANTFLDQGQGVPWFVTGGVFAIAMLASSSLGFLIERFAYRPLRGTPRLTVLITAIGVSLLLAFGGQLVFSPDPQGFPPLVPDTNLAPLLPLPEGSRFSLALPQVFIVVSALVLMLGLQMLIERTKVGRAMRAVSLDRSAAALMGISVDRVIAFTFVLGSALAAAAGVLNSIYQPSIDPLMGVNVGLRAFVAAVLGGIGSIPGAMLGAMLLALAETLTVVVGLSQYREAVAFAILIGVLILKPAGLLGSTVAEKV